MTITQLDTPPHALTAAQQALVPIAAFAAVGDLEKLTCAISHGLDKGLTVSDIKEVLVQLSPTLIFHAASTRSAN